MSSSDGYTAVASEVPRDDEQAVDAELQRTLSAIAALEGAGGSPLAPESALPPPAPPLPAWSAPWLRANTRATEQQEFQDALRRTAANGHSRAEPAGGGASFGWDPAAHKSNHTRDTDTEPAPRWFEGHMFRHLEGGRVQMYVNGLLILAPFLTSTGSLAKLLYECPSVSMAVDGMFGVGTFMFTAVWSFYFTGLVDAVKGAYRVEELVNEELTDLVAKRPTSAQDDADDEEDEEEEPMVRLQSLRRRNDDVVRLQIKKGEQAREWLSGHHINLQEETARAELREEVITRELGALYAERQGVDELTWMRQSDYVRGSKELSDLQEEQFSQQEMKNICAYLKQHCGGATGATATADVKAVIKNLGLDQLREIAKDGALKQPNAASGGGGLSGIAEQQQPAAAAAAAAAAGLPSSSAASGGSGDEEEKEEEEEEGAQLLQPQPRFSHVSVGLIDKAFRTMTWDR